MTSNKRWIVGVLLILTLTLLLTGCSKEKSREVKLEERLDQLLSQGKQVATPLNTKTIKRGENKIFGVGVLNIKNRTTDFKITITPADAVNETGGEIKPKPHNSTWLRYDKSNFSLNSNEERLLSVLARVPTDAPKGTYAFNVKVKYKNQRGNIQQYDNTKKIYVKVP